MIDTSAIKAKLEEKLRELTERADDIDDDWHENAVESEEDEVKEKVGNMAVKEIQQIKFALSRLATGAYGQCTSCSEPIAAKRLEALPYATKCIDCS